MAAFVSGVSRNLTQLNRKCGKILLGQSGILVNNTRNYFFFKHLAEKLDHKEEYQYEVSKDPEEWKYVERLMPPATVPDPQEKSFYPSGWRPMKEEEALKHPYFVERSKNHMLSVYLNNLDRGQLKITRIKKIRGDIWALHNELKAHIEEKVGKKIASFVHEGNNMINFKGDFVYYVEQWLLNKGF